MTSWSRPGSQRSIRSAIFQQFSELKTARVVNNERSVPILWALQHDLPFRIPPTLRIGRIRLADPAHWQRVVRRYGIAHLSD
jgi:hypothetical protein